MANGKRKRTKIDWRNMSNFKSCAISQAKTNHIKKISLNVWRFETLCFGKTLTQPVRLEIFLSPNVKKNLT